MCHAVRYEVTARPLALYTCHCTLCQRRTGSAFSLNMPVATETFRLTQGQPKAWRSRSPSGAHISSWFCETCGTRLYSVRDGRRIVTVRAGTLDNTSWLFPVAHYFMGNAQPWERIIPSTAPCYDGYTDTSVSAEMWRQFWEEPR
jgi:hypothetical protein